MKSLTDLISFLIWQVSWLSGENVEYIFFRSIIIIITIFIIVIMAIITFIIAARPFEINLCMISINLHVRFSLAV